MRGSLYETEVATTRKGAIQVQKQNLNRRKTLSKGGATYALEGLQHIREKRIAEAKTGVKNAKRDLQIAENKIKKEFNLQGVQQRKEEINRKKAILQLRQQHLPIPPSLETPILDCLKDPFLLHGQEVFRASQALYDSVACAEIALKEAQQLPLREYSSISLPQELLDREERLIIERKSGPLQQRILAIDIGCDEEGEVILREKRAILILRQLYQVHLQFWIIAILYGYNSRKWSYN